MIKNNTESSSRNVDYELVVLKFGGGLITDKHKLCTPNVKAIYELCCCVKQLLGTGSKYRLILVHGAGSYGHLKAKAWRLAEGRQVGWVSQDPMGLVSQEEAVRAVQADMLDLNAHVLSGLAEHGIQAETYSPRDWAVGTGLEFVGSLNWFFEHLGPTTVPVTHGDVVYMEDGNFGILSGDDLVYRIAAQAAHDRPVHVVFAMTGAPGLMTCPPEESGSSLVKEWHMGDSTSGLKHDKLVDVTGGIQLKLDRSAQLCGLVDNIWLVDGNCPDRILQAVMNCETIGTRILPSN